jgi:hypothetical protein
MKLESSVRANLARRGGSAGRRLPRLPVGVVAVLAALAMLGVCSAPALAAQALRQIDVNTAKGCCVCRGPQNGDVNDIASCADDQLVEACLLKCKSENARSLAFGYQQTCASGCAGFPTQQ